MVRNNVSKYRTSSIVVLRYACILKFVLFQEVRDQCHLFPVVLSSLTFPLCLSPFVDKNVTWRIAL